MTRIAEAYKKHMNLKLAANELGMPWQSLYVQLKKEGVPVTGDKLRYGSDKDKLAAYAEKIFLSLVPKAENMNLVKFQSKFDFKVGNVSVDVKSSRAMAKNKLYPQSLSWAFSIKKQTMECDFLCCFCLNEDKSVSKVILIPSETFSGLQTITVSCTGKSRWLDYEIPAEDLARFFDDVNELETIKFDV
jgi:hypothetical protein